MEGSNEEQEWEVSIESEGVGKQGGEKERERSLEKC